MSSPAVQNEDWGHLPSEGKREEILRAMEVSTGEGPGRFLKALREHAEIPELEAASRLNVSLSQLRALEQDQFDMLPAPIYVRNYMRRYAELLSIPVEKVIASYERCGECDEPNLQRVSLRDHLNSRHISMRWATYSVIALLLGLMLLWGRNAGLGDLVDRFKLPSADVTVGAPAELALPKPSASSEIDLLEDMATGNAPSEAGLPKE